MKNRNKKDPTKSQPRQGDELPVEGFTIPEEITVLNLNPSADELESDDDEDYDGSYKRKRKNNIDRDNNKKRKLHQGAPFQAMEFEQTHAPQSSTSTTTTTTTTDYDKHIYEIQVLLNRNETDKVAFTHLAQKHGHLTLESYQTYLQKINLFLAFKLTGFNENQPILQAQLFTRNEITEIQNEAINTLPEFLADMTKLDQKFQSKDTSTPHLKKAKDEIIKNALEIYNTYLKEIELNISFYYDEISKEWQSRHVITSHVSSRSSNEIEADTATSSAYSSIPGIMLFNQPKEYKPTSTKTFIELIDQDSDVYNHLISEPKFKQLIFSKQIPPLKLTVENTNIFKISNNKLIEKITNITHYVLMDRHSTDFISTEVSGEGEEHKEYIDFRLETKTLSAILDYAINIMKPENVTFDKNNFDQDSWESSCLDIVIFVVGLRAMIEIKNNNLIYPKISEKEAKDDFNKLKEYRSTVTETKDLSLHKYYGKTAADYFTFDIRQKAYRVRVAERNGRINYLNSASPKKVYATELIFTSRLRVVIKKKYYEIFKSSKAKPIKMTEVRNDIRRNYMVGQFPPQLLFDFINYLEAKNKIQISENAAIFDPSGGYCARLIAAFAHPYFQVCITNDPNKKLGPRYHQAKDLFASGKTFHLFQQRIEDINPEDIPAFNFAFSSIPYGGNEVYYKTMTDYSNVQNVHGLHHGVLRSMSRLEHGGVMGINLGLVGNRNKTFFNLPQMFREQIDKYPYLQFEAIEPCYLHSIQGTNRRDEIEAGKEYIVWATRKPASLGKVNDFPVVEEVNEKKENEDNKFKNKF